MQEAMNDNRILTTTWRPSCAAPRPTFSQVLASKIAGFGHTVPRSQQILLLLAALLSIAQATAYLIEVHRDSSLEPRQRRAPGQRLTVSGRVYEF
jgi:hypothetical protein